MKVAEDEGVEAEEQQQFQSLVGSLLYAAVHTRPDISFSVGQLARVVQNPSEEQVVKYLNSHPSIGAQYSATAQVKQKGVEVLKEKGERLGEGKLFLTCFIDATWASEKDDSSSVGGYICVVGGGPASWRSKKQTETALSSFESEYMAMFHGVKEVIWLRRLLEEIGQEQKVATPLFCDSKGALGMARNAVLHGLNKHIRIKWHCLRKEVKRGMVNPIYIKTHQQPADFLTKRLADEPHWRCVRMTLATTEASTLRGCTSTSTTAAATSTTAAAASTTVVTASTTPTPTAATEAPTPATTPTSTATPSDSSTSSTTAPTIPSTTLAPLALGVAAPPTRSRRSPDLLSANEVDSSSRSNRGEKGDGGTPLKERAARVAAGSTYS
ncbi:unnamed protein product [Closterium sp. NIES-54]